MKRRRIGLAGSLVFAAAFAARVDAAPIPVQLVHEADGWHLLRGGEPYPVKGAGGADRLEELARCGANSIRTWGADDLLPLLDRAHAHGLSVAIGFWMGHPRHGFDYHDADTVWAQVEKARAVVLRYRDHPALLMWSIGNEMEEDGSDPAIWFAVNQVARMCRELDPHHPTMTVIAELGDEKIANLHRFCPDIDIVGINTYGGAQSMGRRYREAGGTKPYMITEFGPPGHWEMDATPWGAPRELTSTEKADWYGKAYQASVLDQADLCVGSYAFLWGHKQEATATWYGMFLEDGTRLGAVEAMTEAWGGTMPSNRCPVISPVELDRVDDLQPGETILAAVDVSDPDGDALELRWILRGESGNYSTGGDPQEADPAVSNAVVPADHRTATVHLPDSGGAFRLYAYAYDGHGNAAVATQPIWISGPAAPPIVMPFVLFGEGQVGEPYAPSGYMGNTDAITMDPACGTSPQAGETCLKVDYRASDDWGGVVWQSPPDNWGDQEGGYDLGGADALEFWARGAQGGELLTVSLGLLGTDKTYPDSGTAERRDLKLTTDWQRFQISVTGLDLTSIKTGFAWTVAGQGAPLTFYLDEIRYVGDAK